MVIDMFTYPVFIGIVVIITRGYGFTNYNIFKGFDVEANEETLNTTTEIKTTTQFVETFRTDKYFNVSTITPTTIHSISTTFKKKIGILQCIEEKPSNIGTYEVPSHKDIVLFTKNLLIDSFETYKKDAMSLLRDIKEVTKATASIENKCQLNKTAYKQCVKRVSGQSEAITKSLVTSLEMEKLDVKDLTENNICSLSDMKNDPITLIKTIAQEQAMIKFALPGFLRLIHVCSTLCEKSQATGNKKKPLRRVTDQELVVRYLLRKKE